MKKPTKIIGILGGAGPAATANFFSDIVSISQKVYLAEQDTDFPVCYLYNMPMEGFDETGFSNPDLIKKQLIEGVKKIENWGADFIVIPCNTVHYFVEDMRSVLSIPILSIIESTVKEIKKIGYKKIGILSSASTRNLSLYEKSLKENGFETIITTNDEQKILDNIVLSVMSGGQSKKEIDLMNNIIKRMKNEGAESIILGCTELPLAITQKDSLLPLLNTIYILAKSTVDYSYN